MSPQPAEDLVTTRLHRFTRMLQGVESSDARAIHRTRVASRRLRELLPVLQLDNDTAAKLAHRLRKVTRHLGVVRELDVLAALLLDMREGWRSGSRAGRLLESDIRRARAGARRKHSGKKIAAEMDRVARKIEKAVNSSHKNREKAARARRWAIDARVARRATATHDAVERAGALYLSDRLHTLRIAVKKFRYALELASDTVPTPAGLADLRLLRQIQRTLGRLHDLQVLADRVRAVQASLQPGDVAVMHDLDTLLIEVENACRRMHARYVRRRAALLEVCAHHVATEVTPAAIRKAV